MDITFLSALTSYLAGILSVLAPCALPLLPLILQGSQSSKKNVFSPLIISSSLAISFIIFTFLLKTSVGFLGLNESVIKIISGLILVLVSITYIFPSFWNSINVALRLSKKSDEAMEQAAKKEGVISDILTGAALGPVFTTCSPTYGIIVSQVLQSSPINAFILTVLFALGLLTVLLLISWFGRNLVKKITFLANPNGSFRKIIGVLLFVFGFMIITGLDKQLEIILVEFFGNTFGWYGTTQLETNLLKQLK